MVVRRNDPAYPAELVRLAQADSLLDSVVNPMYGGLYERDGDA